MFCLELTRYLLQPWSIEFFLVAPHVINLPDDHDDEPLRVRRNRRALAGKTPQSAPASEAVARDGGDTTRASVTFAVPLTSVRPSTSTANPPSLFATYPAPEDQASAAKEAIRQAGIMMEQVKVAREASQAAYDASSTLQSNVQVCRLNTWSVTIRCLKDLYSEDLYICTPTGCVCQLSDEWGHAKCTHWV